MMRGLTPTLEKHHKVRILDEAVEDAVKLSHRYITDRQLPDKAVSLLDTACARVALSQSPMPAAARGLPPRDRAPRTSRSASSSARADLARGTASALDETARAASQAREAGSTDAGEALDGGKADWSGRSQSCARSSSRPLGNGQGEPPRQLGAPAEGTAAEELRQLEERAARAAGRNAAGPSRWSTARRLPKSSSGWTGIPVGKMVRNEIADGAHAAAQAGRARHRPVPCPGGDCPAHSHGPRPDLTDPRRPIGVFLLVGPSGVGKTETALALADILYGGDRNMVVINMSEYKEEHKISRLTGSAPGYVGYGEGGVLTEAVRRKPYSVVLLDEVEKANADVQEIFYQVFDKGMLQDDKGNEVNFKNTIILLTSNVGTDTIMKLCADPDTRPDRGGSGGSPAARPAQGVQASPAGPHARGAVLPAATTRCSGIIRLQLQRIANRSGKSSGRVHLRRRRGRDDRQPLQGSRERRPQRRPIILTGTLVAGDARRSSWASWRKGTRCRRLTSVWETMGHLRTRWSEKPAGSARFTGLGRDAVIGPPFTAGEPKTRAGTPRYPPSRAGRRPAPRAKPGEPG